MRVRVSVRARVVDITCGALPALTGVVTGVVTSSWPSRTMASPQSLDIARSRHAWGDGELEAVCSAGGENCCNSRFERCAFSCQ